MSKKKKNYTRCRRKIPIDPIKLEASVCRDSFYDFLIRFWDSIIAEPFNDNWHIKFLCDEMQEIAERVFNRQPKEYDLIINISPGSTKSTICSVMFPIWAWLNDPTIRTICGSYAFPLSLYLASQSRKLIKSDKFIELFPHIKLEEEQKGLMVNNKGGQRIATSTGGSITGMHGHFLIVDDPINPQEALSKTVLKSANDWMEQTLLTRKVNKKITPLILIMQRLHQEDPSQFILDKKGRVRHICLPAILNDDIKPRRLRQYYQGGLMDSKRITYDLLEEEKINLGEYAFAGQFMQSPIPAGGAMFKTGKIQIEKSTNPRMKQVVRYWDKAGTGGRGCYTVGIKMGKDTQNRFWVLDVVRGQWESNEREQIIKRTAAMDGKKVMVGIEQEPGSGGKESAQNTIRMLAGYRVRADRPSGDKTLRADPYSVQVNAGNVVLLDAEWNKPYIDELQFFPFGRLKDQVDASSGAFSMLTKIKHMVGALGATARSDI